MTSPLRAREADLREILAEAGVGVKPLVWGQDHVRNRWYGNTPAPETGLGYIVKENGAWCRANGPWVLDQLGDVGSAKAAAQADYEARILSALTPAPVAWCQPMENGRHASRKFIVRFEDQDVPDAVFEDEAEARDHWERAITNWNCYLFGALPLRSILSALTTSEVHHG